MGNKESVDHHILLYGQSQHGKTNFLYDNFLNGNIKFKMNNKLEWGDEQQKIESSLGYNFELINTLNDVKYGVWDISGHPEFVDLQDLFIKTIPFSGILYIIRPVYEQGNLIEDKLKQIGTARQHIHYLANHRYFVNKFFLIILNVIQILKQNKEDFILSIYFQKIEEEQLTENGSDDVQIEKFEQVIDEIKELIKYDQIPVKSKEMIIIDRGSAYAKLWEKVGQLTADIKKQ